LNPLTLLLPILLGVALLVGAMTGHLTPEQLAAGAALLLVPGADRFGPLLRQLLQSPAPSDPTEAAAQAAYERYGDACGWKVVGGGQMPRWADQQPRLRACWREAARGVLGLQPSVTPGELAPVAPPPATPPGLPPAALAFLVPFLLLAPSCASWPAWRAALAACGVQVAPAGVQSGVALALHKGDGWEEALGELVATYGGCLIKAQVQAHAEGAGSDPPRAQAETAPLASLIGGELGAAPSAVTRAEAQQRAAAWLRGHR